MIKTEKCNICQSSELENIISLPDLPLTGLYMPKTASKKSPVFDNSFLICRQCGHGQLEKIIDMQVLYDDTYTHRSSSSPISTSGNDFFLNYLNKICKAEKFKSILEIGCNDLYLINKIQNKSDFITGIDPIWKDKDFQHNSKTKILGKFVHELDTDSDLSTKPDLIISAHTFEHVNETYEQFKMLYDLSADECTFIIEVPCLDTMINISRYDQIFHQHLQYLSLSSMVGLINKLGCSYIDHTFNYSYWGGTILFAFKKSLSENIDHNPSFKLIDYEIIKNEILSFKRRAIQTKNKMLDINEKIYGFGAAQMLPILAYHMETDLSFIEGIIDDNPDRVGQFLPNIEAPIISSENLKNIDESCIFISALDSTRPILKRIIDLNPRKIINPINLF